MTLAFLSYVLKHGQYIRITHSPVSKTEFKLNFINCYSALIHTYIHD